MTKVHKTSFRFDENEAEMIESLKKSIAPYSDFSTADVIRYCLRYVHDREMQSKEKNQTNKEV